MNERTSSCLMVVLTGHPFYSGARSSAVQSTRKPLDLPCHMDREVLVQRRELSLDLRLDVGRDLWSEVC
jgi:hypothetical protein